MARACVRGLADTDSITVSSITSPYGVSVPRSSSGQLSSGLVGEDGFASGGGEGADGAEGAEAGGAGGGGVGEEEDAAGAGPEAVEGGVVVEDGGGVRPEAAVPGAVNAAVDEVRGLAGVEEKRRAGGQFAVDEDEVGGRVAGCRLQVAG